MLRNYIDQSSYSAEFIYLGQKDDDVKLLIDKINKHDVRNRLNVYIWERIFFTENSGKQLLKALHNRRIHEFKITKYLNRQEAKVVINFLNSPDVTYAKYDIRFEDTDDVIGALKAIENKFSFICGQIVTEEPVSKEAEELALAILQTHYDCTLYLNSEVKALKHWKKRGLEKIYMWF